MRLAIFLLLVVVLFGPFNIIAVRQLLRIHPRARPFTIALAIAGNVMWFVLPFGRALTPLTRVLRAVAGPPWLAWTLFSLLYSIFLLIVVVCRIPKQAASRVFIIAMTVVGAIGCWQALVPLRVERVPVAIRDLPPEAEGMKIALLADLHVGLFTRPSRLRTIFSTTDALRPDVVFLAGDLVDDDPYFIPKLLDGARSLSPRTPLYAVLGNHEMYGDPLRAIAGLRGSRVQLLVNEGVPFRGLWLAGLSDYAARSLPRLEPLAPNVAAAMAKRPASALPIVVAHQPRAFEDARSAGAALTLVAHTHGGQCGIRPLHWSVAGIFLPYHMGLYRKGDAQLYVNTGTGYWMLPFRLGMTSEITLIELHRQPR